MKSNALVTVEIAGKAEHPTWDSLVAGCPGGHHEQTCGWGSFKRTVGWEPRLILVRCDGRLLGGALLLCRTLRRLFTIGYISRGPVCFTADRGDFDLVARSVLDELAKMSLSYVVVVPHYEAAGMVPILRSHGFYPKPDLLPPSKLISATLVLDLNNDLNSILSAMHSTTRNKVRRGMKSGIEVSEGGAADVPTFFRLMVNLCERRGIRPSPAATLGYYEDMLKCLGPGYVKVFVARYGAEPVSAAFAFVFGDSMRVWKVGWSGEHARCQPNRLMWWEMMKWAKNANLRWFDFVQILPDHANALLRGEKVNDEYWGVTQFKLGFGGKLLILPEAHYRSFHGLIHPLLRFGGARLIGSKRGSWVAQKVSRRAASEP